MTWRLLFQEHPKLAAAVHPVFGGIVAARRAAGLREPETPKGRVAPKWDEDAVITEIRRRQRRGESLTSSEVRFLPGGLFKAAVRHCGSWREAIELAGFDYDAIRLIPEYEAEELLKKVRDLADRKPSLHLAALRRSPLGRAALRRFKTVAKLRAALGLSGWPVERRHAILSDAQIRRRLLARVRARKPITVEAVRADEDELYTAVRRRHVSWPAALRLFGIPHEERVAWTRELVLERLRARIDGGKPATDHALHDDDPPLYGACQRLFGSRPKAVALALRGAARKA